MSKKIIPTKHHKEKISSGDVIGGDVIGIGIEGGSLSNDRKRHLQQKFQYLLSEITSSKLNVWNLIIYHHVCQRATGQKFKKVKLT